MFLANVFPLTFHQTYPLLCRLFGSMILRIAYGLEVDRPGNEKYLDLVEDGVAVFSTVLVPGAFLVEAFPFLRHFPAWFPGAGFKRNVVRWRHDIFNVLHIPWEAVKSMMVRPSRLHALVSDAHNSHIHLRSATGSHRRPWRGT